MSEQDRAKVLRDLKKVCFPLRKGKTGGRAAGGVVRLNRLLTVCVPPRLLIFDSH